MSARARMTHRMVLERNAETGTSWNVPLKPNYQPHITVPCFTRNRAKRHVVGVDQQVIVEDLGALVPWGTDVVKATDRVANITDRLGNVIHPGPIRIETIEPKTEDKHLELMLQRVANA